jgi:hypothetical protein
MGGLTELDSCHLESLRLETRDDGTNKAALYAIWFYSFFGVSNGIGIGTGIGICWWRYRGGYGGWAGLIGSARMSRIARNRAISGVYAPMKVCSEEDIVVVVVVVVV